MLSVRRAAPVVVGLTATLVMAVTTSFLWATDTPASADAFAGALPNGGHLTREVSALPERLSETGLYLADGSIDPRNRPFVPVYPLWTDGAAKRRWIRLPEGARIDVSDIDAWRFPPGTILWKEFSWRGRKVETRMIRVESDSQVTFAAYVWNDSQTEALLAPAEGVPRAFEIVAGKRHAIPGVADCGACHKSGPTPVLGFNALQLSDERDPLAPHAAALGTGAVTLRTLVEEDRLQPARPELVTRPPRIRERDPVGRAAIGYLSTNCGVCHNARGPLTRLGFSLQHDASGAPNALEPALATTLGATGRFVVSHDGAASARLLVPGSPSESVLLQRMSSRRSAVQMPPLGTVLADMAAIKLVSRWIAGLRAAASR